MEVARMNDEPLIRLDPKAPWPHWPPAEKAMLSIILQEPAMIAEIPGAVEDYFHIPAHRIIYRTIQAIASRSGTPDMFDEIVRTLHQSGELDQIGGPSLIGDLMTYTPVPTRERLKKAEATLRKEMARRQAINAGINLIEEGFGCGEEVERVTEAAGGPITAIHETLGESTQPKSMKALVRECLESYLRRVKGEERVKGADTGIEEIDQTLRGIIPGRMWVIGAYPSGGKSIIGGQIFVKCALTKLSPVFITLEMEEKVMLDRCLIQAAKVPANAFIDPPGYAVMVGKEGPTEGIRRALNWAAEQFLTSSWLIRKPSQRTLTAILSIIRKAHREIGARMVVIDYVQLVRIPGHKSREAEISEISHAFQEIALELGIHVIVLSQINADGDTKHGRVIEEDADAFLQIVQEMDKTKDNFKEHQHILIVKDRHFGNGGRKLPLIFDPESIRFVTGSPASSQSDGGQRQSRHKR